MNETLPTHVILDLLPLYFEGEVSEETRVLIEDHLRRDPQLRDLVDEAGKPLFLQAVPAPLKKETEMEALRKTKRMMVQHNVFLIMAIILSLMTGLSYLFLGDEPRGAAAPFIFGGLAAVFWLAFFFVNRSLDR